MSSSKNIRSVVIVGGAGFIGSNLAERLLQTTEARVHILDNLSRNGVPRSLESLRKLAGNSGRLEITVGDVRNAALVERVLNGATEVYHFAAQVAVTTAIENPRLDFETNLMGTFNVLEAVRKSGACKFLLYTSTNKVYGELATYALRESATRYEFADAGGVSEAQPLDFHSPYGCSKGGADQYVRDYARIYGIPSVVFRMSCIAGPRQFGNEDQGWVAHFLYSALQGIPITIYGDGRQVRDVLCVHDLLNAMEAARKSTAVTRGQIYNVGGGPANAISLLELAEEVQRLTGKPLRYVFASPRAGDQLVYVTDFSRLWADTKWSPQITVRQTLERIYDWWKLNRETPVEIPEYPPVLQELTEAA